MVTVKAIKESRKQALKALLGSYKLTKTSTQHIVEVLAANRVKSGDIRWGFIAYGAAMAVQTGRLLAHQEMHIRALTAKEYAKLLAHLYANKGVKTEQDVIDFLRGKPVSFEL